MMSVSDFSEKDVLRKVTSDYSRSLSAVLPALTAAIGSPVDTEFHPDAKLCQQRLGVPDARSAIVILIDGLGYWNLVDRIGHAPYLRSLFDASDPEHSAGLHSIVTCYPTTTAAAMGSFGTGTCPGLTGMLGYTQLNPRTGRIAQMIQFKGAPKPEELQQEPTVFEKAAAKNVPVASIGLPAFKRSPLTRAALRGTTYVPDRDPLGRAEQAAKCARKPGLTYLYIRVVDKAGHHYGWQSDEWATSLESADRQVRLVRELAPAGTVIAVVADHGMVTMDSSLQIDVAQEPELSQGVALTGGEPRALMLYAKRKANPDAIAQRWRNRLEEQATVMTKNQAINAGLFGTVSERVRPMIGDIVVLCAGRTTIVDSRIQHERAMAMPGVHGSWTEAEARIPFLLDLN